MRKLLAVAFLASLAACSLFGGGDGGDSAVDGGLGQMCSTADDCGAAFICAGGRCQLEGTVGQGATCWATRDCEAGLFCRRDGVCAPAGDGEVDDPCGTDDQCARGLVCELFGFGGRCVEAGQSDVGASCGANADCIAGLACGPEMSCGHPSVVYPPFAGVDCAEDEAEFRAYFELSRGGAPLADFYRLPFPNDARVDADGALDLSDFPRPGQGLLGVDLVSLYADALVADFSGFSSVAPVSFRFSSALDFASITPEAIHYIDVTPGAPEYGSDRNRSWSYDAGRGLYRCQNFLTVSSRPHEPLLPGHVYAVFLGDTIRGAGGETPTQDADLAALLASTAPGDAALATAWDHYAPFRSYLAGEGIAPGSVAAAAVFTVQDTTGPAEALAAAVAAGPAPVLSDLTLCDGAATSPCEDATGRGACGEPQDDFYEIHGRYAVPIYQRGTPPYERPEDGGDIVFDDAGEPVLQGTDEVCFALTIPKRAAPAAGFPLVVYAHGTGGSFRGAVGSGVASSLAGAATPMAMFSYDGVVHGDRRNGSVHSPDELMFNVLNPRAARDNNLQGGVDLLLALRLPELGTIALPGAGDVSFDPASTAYFGHSQGSNVGVPAIAVSDATRVAIFSGAGGHLVRALLTKTSPVDAGGSLEFLVGEELSVDHPVMVLWQTFFDRVETVSFGPLLVDRPLEGTSSKHVMMTWGPGDTYSPVPTLNVMARSAGLPVVEPVIQDLDTGVATRPVSGNVTGGDGAARTAACFQYEADGYDGHFVATRNPDAIGDWIELLESAVGGATPTVE